MWMLELTAVTLLLVLLFFALRRWAYVRVPELEIAVVDQTGSNKFLR
ncbi:MAG: hypothetical protein GWP17_06860, partial [Aquificales bacterium]|nr:hypothetical protein [Aquificales bacterium]